MDFREIYRTIKDAIVNPSNTSMQQAVESTNLIGMLNSNGIGGIEVALRVLYKLAKHDDTRVFFRNFEFLRMLIELAKDSNRLILWKIFDVFQFVSNHLEFCEQLIKYGIIDIIIALFTKYNELDITDVFLQTLKSLCKFDIGRVPLFERGLVSAIVRNLERKEEGFLEHELLLEILANMVTTSNENMKLMITKTAVPCTLKLLETQYNACKLLYYMSTPFESCRALLANDNTLGIMKTRLDRAIADINDIFIHHAHIESINFLLLALSNIDRRSNTMFPIDNSTLDLMFHMLLKNRYPETTSDMSLFTVASVCKNKRLRFVFPMVATIYFVDTFIFNENLSKFTFELSLDLLDAIAPAIPRTYVHESGLIKRMTKIMNNFSRFPTDRVSVITANILYSFGIRSLQIIAYKKLYDNTVV